MSHNFYASLSKFVLTFNACSVGVAFQAGRADAHGPVIVDAANGGGCALLRHTRVTALLADACEHKRAFRVRRTFRFRC